MSKCTNFCVTVSGTTNEEIWREISLHIGPKNVTTSGAMALMEKEIGLFEDWVLDNHQVPFGDWLLWYRRVGTTNYGNLPLDKKHDGKVGHCYAPCPYSTQSSDFRTRLVLGLDDDDPLPVKVDHSLGDTTYYMKTASRGSKWGFECTYASCPFNAITGQKYFYT